MVTNYELISFIKSSKYRERVLLALVKPMTPSQLAKELSLDKPHVSRALKSLEEKELVVCLTPESRKYKLFQQTKKGSDLKLDLENHS